MPNGWTILLDLIITLSAALGLGLLLEKLKQSAVIGYLLAGVLVGPSLTGWVKDIEIVNLLSELGVALLLFTIGLEFSWRRLLRLGKIAFIGGTVQIGLVMAAVMGLAMLFGIEWRAALLLGGVASMASTSIVLRLLKERNELDSSAGKASIGVLLAQDIAVVPLVMMATFLTGGIGSGSKGGGSVGELLLKSVVFLFALWLVVIKILPRALDARLVARNREFVFLTAICTCIAATWGAHFAGLSPALGAFLSGMLLAEFVFADQMRSDVNSLKTLFVTVFFASVGMVLDVNFFVQNLPLVIGVLVLILILKAILTAVAVKPFLPSVIASGATGIILCQVGEFSFLLTKIGHEGKLLSPFLFQLVISVSVLSLVMTPWLVSRANPVARWMAIRLIPTRKLAEAEEAGVPKLGGHILLIGFGESGQKAAAKLTEQSRPIMVVDYDRRLVALAKERGFHAHLGDASQAEILMECHLPEAVSVVITIPEPVLSGGIVGLCKTLAPHVPVVARGRYHVMVGELDCKGADLVVDEESLVGEQLGLRVMECLVPDRKN